MPRGDLIELIWCRDKSVLFFVLAGVFGVASIAFSIKFSLEVNESKWAYSNSTKDNKRSIHISLPSTGLGVGRLRSGPDPVTMVVFAGSLVVPNGVATSPTDDFKIIQSTDFNEKRIYNAQSSYHSIHQILTFPFEFALCALLGWTSWSLNTTRGEGPVGSLLRLPLAELILAGSNLIADEDEREPKE